MSVHLADKSRRLTPKGEATRARIVEAASRLMLEGGVARTTIEDIQQVAQVSASQMYHYFQDKNALVLAVIDRETDLVLGVQHQGLDRVDSIEALRKWRDLIVSVLAEAGCVGGCPLGSLASDLSEIDPIARARLAQSFERWEQLLRDGFTAMHRHGELGPDANPDDLAVAMLAAVQGGLLLSQVRRNTKPLQTAVDTMIAHVESFATAAATPAPPPRPASTSRSSQSAERSEVRQIQDVPATLVPGPTRLAGPEGNLTTCGHNTAATAGGVVVVSD